MVKKSKIKTIKKMINTGTTDNVPTDDEVFLQYNRLCLAKHRMDRKCHISYERVEQNLLNNIKELELKIRIKKINKIKKNIK